MVKKIKYHIISLNQNNWKFWMLSKLCVKSEDVYINLIPLWIFELIKIPATMAQSYNKYTMIH